MPIDVHPLKLNKIFDSPYWFSIPYYQRPYRWGKDEILDLLDDVNEACLNARVGQSAEYFLGSIVLQKNQISDPETGEPRDEYEVLDGQQRLTTLFITLTVLSKLIKDEKASNNLRGKVHQQRDEIDNEPEIIRIKYAREEANEIIRNLLTAPQYDARIKEDCPTYGIEDISAKNIIRALNIIKGYFQDEDRFKEGDTSLKAFASFLCSHTIIIDVSADTRTEAFRLFSILNNRGMPLTNADIIKAENIGALANTERRAGTQDWERVENGLKNDDIDNFLQFIRTIYLKAKQEDSLLDEFDKKIYKTTSNEQPLLHMGKETINALKTYYNIYDDIIMCNDIDDIAGNNSAQYKQILHIMKRSIRSNDWIPPLMYFYKEFIMGNSVNFVQILEFVKKLEYKFVGDWICGEKPTARRNAMYAILKKIENIKETGKSPFEIINDNELFYVDENKLRNVLNDNIYGEDYATYVLLKLEYLCNDGSSFTEYKKISIEHVLPQTVASESQWSIDFQEEQRKYWTHRLANLLLLNPIKNQTFRNADFAIKKERYFGIKDERKRAGIDKFLITRYTLENTDIWTSKVLEKRQKELINFFIRNKPIYINEIQESVKIG